MKIYIIKMGGFNLYGDNYEFHSFKGRIDCRCEGFRKKIDEELETSLLNKEEKKITKELIDSLGGSKHHIGEILEYYIVDIKKEKEFRETREKNFLKENFG